MNVTEAFLSSIKGCEEYNKAFDIVSRNSSGKVWLVGGFVYRSIASKLYDLPRPEVDLDFVVEKPVSEFDLPEGWKVHSNRYGNPKLIKGNKQIDYVPLENIYSILQRQIEATIENYLSGVPLTIQAIAFDVYDAKIIGEKGIDALQRRAVEVNNLENAKYAAEKKEKSVKEMIQEKADSLLFNAIFP